VLDAEIVVVDRPRLLDRLAAREDAQMRRRLAAERHALVETQIVRDAKAAVRDAAAQDRCAAILRRRDLLDGERHAGGDRTRRVDAPAIDGDRLLVLARQ